MPRGFLHTGAIEVTDQKIREPAARGLGRYVMKAGLPSRNRRAQGKVAGTGKWQFKGV